MGVHIGVPLFVESSSNSGSSCESVYGDSLLQQSDKLYAMPSCCCRVEIRAANKPDLSSGRNPDGTPKPKTLNPMVLGHDRNCAIRFWACVQNRGYMGMMETKIETIGIIGII